MNIKKLLVVLSFIITPVMAYQRFPGSAANYQNYYLAGEFGFQAPFVSNDTQYNYTISSISNFSLPANNPMRLATLLGSHIDQMKISNGTKIILQPDLVAAGKTKEEKKSTYDTLPYVVIEGADDFITVYVYLYSAKIGTKLIFNILAFEDFMMKTQLAKTAAPSTGWHIGFEFNTANADFNINPALFPFPKQPTLFSNQQGIHPFFIDLVFDQYEYEKAKSGFFKSAFQWYDRVPSPFKELEPYLPAQYFIALNGSDFDKSKWNPDVFSQNNITYTRDLSDDDVTHVEKVLTDAGITLSAS